MNASFGIIFDFNGVIVNDERVHEQSWRIMYTKHGFTEDQFRKHFFGKREQDIFEYVHNQTLNPADIDRLSTKRVDIVKELLNNNLTTTPGFTDFLQTLKEKHIPYAIGTSSRRPYLQYILELLSLQNDFSHIVSAENVTHGKPHPEVFLRCAELLHLPPNHCIVFEDTHHGIQAAKNAGMKVVALTTTHDKQDVQKADLIINDFTKIHIDVLDSLVKK